MSKGDYNRLVELVKATDAMGVLLLKHDVLMGRKELEHAWLGVLAAIAHLADEPNHRKYWLARQALTIRDSAEQ